MKWIAILTVIGISTAITQPMRERRGTELPAAATAHFFGFIHAYPNSSNGDSVVCILGYYLLTSDLLYVHRQEVVSSYVAPYVVTIELRDSIGVVRFAYVFRDSVVRPHPPQYWSGDAVANAVVKTLAKGTYTMTADIAQFQRQRLLWQSKFVIGDTPSAIAQMSLVFAQPVLTTGPTCIELIGTTIPFGTRRLSALVVVPRMWAGREQIVAQCVLRKQYFPFYRNSDSVDIPATSQGEVLFTLPSCTVEQNPQRKEVCLQLMPNDRYRTLRYVLDLRRAVPGDYELVLMRPSTKDTLRVPFRLQWFVAPPQLFAGRYAVDVMQYVLTDEEYQRFRDLPDTVRLAAILAWWQKHDPTPATAYNEAMMEYFRRAYEARTKFATAQSPDGALTERGKIYILFGEPSQIETNFEEGRPGIEVWTYTNVVGKRFTFEISSEGVYRLVKIEPL
ncbi:MAG: GWxTD domain-containing protein [Bacteroidota bacterium]|nr:GWxTD domain-containing protein [Bacteroidota bacterium]